MANEGDRISHLPDDILLHILSFLQYTVERARTSLLSKRWRNLWAYHPVIRFSSHQPRFSHVGPDTRDHIRAVDECLKGFKAPTLQTLEIVIWLPGHKCSTSEAEASARATARWILFAGLRSVRNLHLWVEPLKRRPDIQGSIFCCQMITALDLVLCTIEGVPSLFQGFIFLKDLKLSCSPVSGNVLCLLLSKCPVLESLCLIGCHNVVNLNVSSQSLRHIVLSTGSKRGHVSIDAPNLRSIKFKGKVQNLLLKNAPCLLDANIQNLGTGTSSETRLYDWVRPVEKLQVDHWFFQYVIPKSPLLIFKNLKELHCNNEWVTNPMLRALITIIGHCPTLEKLQVDLFNGNRSRVLAHMRRDNSEVPQEDDRAILSKYVDNYIKGSIDYEERERWGPLEQFGDFGDSSHCLKTVFVKAFLGTTNEMRLVEYLLKNGDALETLTIADFLGRNKEEICQLFTYIPKASPHVQTDARVLLRNFR